jgi:putative ABC transport system ATP-binding protein
MIILQNVYKKFWQNKNESFEALSDINLQIDKGLNILKGVSGSGKSTLLSLIAGFDKPTSGKIVVDDMLISKLPDLHLSNYRNQKIGFVFQHFNLIDSLSVAENILAPLAMSGDSISQAKAKVLQAMREVGIEHKANQNIKNLSGGEKQRCAIARALVNQSDILLCDEPTANLDRENSLKFIEIIRRLNDGKRVIIIATHDPIFDDIDIPSRVIHISDGKIGL